VQNLLLKKSGDSIFAVVVNRYAVLVGKYERQFIVVRRQFIVFLNSHLVLNSQLPFTATTKSDTDNTA
jgi:hypothetical protein